MSPPGYIANRSPANGPFVQAKCTSSLCGVSAFSLGQHRRATIKSAGPSAPMVLATSCKNPSHIRHPPPKQLPIIVHPNYRPRRRSYRMTGLSNRAAKLLRCTSLLLAQSGHHSRVAGCPLLGVTWTCHFALQMSAFDPKRTCPRHGGCRLLTNPKRTSPCTGIEAGFSLLKHPFEAHDAAS